METKEWWQSRTIWGAVVIVISQIAALFGKQLPDQTQLIDAFTLIGTAIGAGLTIYGRVKTTTIIQKPTEEPPAP